MSRAVMQQALEALEKAEEVIEDEYGGTSSFDRLSCAPAITALRAALAEPEQEPVDSPEKAVAYMDARLWEFIDMAAAWPETRPDSRTWDHVMVYAPTPRKPLTDEMVKRMKEVCTSMEMRGAFADGWLSAEAAHGIGEQHE